MTEPQTFAGLNADQVGEMVSAVWDHKDDLASTVAFVREHADDILAVIAKLPDLLTKAAEGLSGAAEGVGSSAAMLIGEGGKGGVRALADAAGDALNTCATELSQAREMLVELGKDLDGVPIPALKPTYSEIMGHKLITGLDVTQGRLLEGAGQRVTQSAARFDALGGQLGDVSVQLKKMGELVEKAAHALADTATKLAEGSTALNGLTSK